MYRTRSCSGVSATLCSASRNSRSLKTQCTSAECRATIFAQHLTPHKNIYFGKVTGHKSPLDADYKADLESPPLPDKLKKKHQSVGGILTYLSCTSMPELAWSVTQVARYNAAPTYSSWEAAKSIARYCIGRRDEHDCGVLHGRDRAMNEPIYTADASFNCYKFVSKDGKRGSYSHYGFIGYLYGGPIAWRSKICKRVLKSVRDAEAIALEAATESALYTRMLLNSLVQLKEPTLVLGDNEALYKGITNQSFKSCDRHILKTYFWIADKVNDDEIRLGLLPTDEMPADIFTKSLGMRKFSYFRKMVSGFSSVDFSRQKDMSGVHFVWLGVFADLFSMD